MDQVIVRLIGGLGNQMFQYAAARAVAEVSNAPLCLDLSWFGTDPDRQFALRPFKIKTEADTQPDNAIPQGNNWAARIDRLIKHRLGFQKDGIPVFNESSFKYDTAIEMVRAPVFLNGYFQSEKYFYAIHHIIADEFTLRDAPAYRAAQILDEIENSDAICVHVRRGDYVSNAAANAYHGTCTLDYYHSGLEIVANGLKNPHCFVFSDDPLWVRKHFKTKLPMTLVDIHGTGEAHEDLRLMAACQCYVIANSSLSWWGAWLGARSNKLVVAPQRWFQDSSNDTSDLIPSNWIQI